jgi:hypothetical protein
MADSILTKLKSKPARFSPVINIKHFLATAMSGYVVVKLFAPGVQEHVAVIGGLAAGLGGSVSNLISFLQMKGKMLEEEKNEE